MEIELLSYTENPIDLLYTACRTCYSKDTPINIHKSDKEKEKKIELINKVFGSGHLSISEHVYFSFAICGVSRAFLAQLSRHRLCSFSVQSQRYVEIKEDLEQVKTIKDFGTEIDKMKLVSKYFVFKDKYDESLVQAYLNDLTTYLTLIKNGEKAEDARNVLPNAFKTNIVMSCNLRQLMHICNLRLCKHTQLEFRKIMEQIKNKVLEKSEYIWLNKYLVPNCKNCTDFRDCKEIK